MESTYCPDRYDTPEREEPSDEHQTSSTDLPENTRPILFTGSIVSVPIDKYETDNQDGREEATIPSSC